MLTKVSVFNQITVNVCHILSVLSAKQNKKAYEKNERWNHGQMNAVTREELARHVFATFATHGCLVSDSQRQLCTKVTALTVVIFELSNIYF